MSRGRFAAPALILVAATALLGVSAGSAFAHGEEADALADTPARTLVQQALGLLTQAGDPVEAAERLEAALKSKDADGVDLARVRDALASLDDGDDRVAVAALNEALAPAKGGDGAGAPSAPSGEAGGNGGSAAGASEAPAASEEALSHSEEFEPSRGSAEWAAFAVGLGAILAGLALLFHGRRRPAA